MIHAGVDIDWREAVRPRAECGGCAKQVGGVGGISAFGQVFLGQPGGQAKLAQTRREW